MRIEPYAVDSFMHVLKRGARGLPITKDTGDQWRFVRLLYFMNDEYKNDFWERDTQNMRLLERPESWPEQRPLVKILAWTLMPNHFHLLLKETKEGGISKFMQKLCGSMSVYSNFKYKEKGSLFQGSYKGKTIGKDSYLRYLAAYIMVKNVFELYPGGYDMAAQDFDKAWQWSVEYRFSSLADYMGNRNSPILDKDILGEIFTSPEDFKKCAQDMILGRVIESDDYLKGVMFDI
jgi:putative transposase